ncbi:patatin-like phospholipase domain-containing protein 4 isoform X2 [Haliotis asinina]|uniref:patatin-like phospholipase domain-containing protein 4 isoform X2 n=1 Tax=Haliotis asinina TaxID=109174 RepID=UPI003531B401
MEFCISAPVDPAVTRPSYKSSESTMKESGSGVHLDMKYNLSLCGSGFLGIYHLGVASCLVNHGQTLLSKVDTIAGASAGSLTAAILVISKDKVPESVDFTKNLAKEIRSKPLGVLTPRYSLLKTVEKFLERTLPQDAHLTASGKLFISLTNVDTKKNEIMSQFDSRDELIKALIASSYIPGYAGLKPPKIKGHRYIDGGVTNNLPSLSGTARNITVSPFSGRQDICPHDKAGKGMFFRHSKQDFQVNFNNLVRVTHALFPPKQKILAQYFEMGERDASRFLRREGLYDAPKPQPVYKKVTQYESTV